MNDTAIAIRDHSNGLGVVYCSEADGDLAQGVEEERGVNHAWLERCEGKADSSQLTGRLRRAAQYLLYYDMAHHVPPWLPLLFQQCDVWR